MPEVDRGGWTLRYELGGSGSELVVLTHGFGATAETWRHQLPAMAALGFRCIAPDMRGYGRSSTYTRHEDFAQEPIVTDMLELLACKPLQVRLGPPRLAFEVAA